MQYCLIQPTEELQNLFRLQSARTYEYFMLHSKALNFDKQTIHGCYPHGWVYISYTHFVRGTWWATMKRNILPIYPNIQQRFDRMIEAKQKFEYAGGTYHE